MAWFKRLLRALPPSVVLLIGSAGIAWAQETAAPTPDDLQLAVDTVWVLIAGVLVIFMQAGFAFLEAGSTRAKNAGHVAAKNLIVLSVASLAFWAIGFAVAFGVGNPIVGLKGFFLAVPEDQMGEVFASLDYSVVPLGAKYIFQLAFAAVSLAIVWGGMAERTRLIVYPLFGLIFASVIYPVTAHWIWGGGWLSKLGMLDFAGSTVVHLQGGTAALIGAMLLGPRIGKYNKDGTANPILGHNLVFAVLGVFILWLGWFGFNPGSTLTAMTGFFAYVAMNTNLAAAAGALSAFTAAWILFGKADIGMILNGVLAALVAITASCAFVEPWAAVAIGGIAGLVMFGTTLFVERKLRIDDPVGAFSVHGTAGIWGTLSLGFLAAPALVPAGSPPGLFYGGGLALLGIQAAGVAAAFAFVAAASYLSFWFLKNTVGLRVSLEDELGGLDLVEHGLEAYPELVIRERRTQEGLIIRPPEIAGLS